MLPAPRGSRTLAISVRRSSTGCLPVTTGAGSSCGSKTPTQARLEPRALESMLDGLRWLNIDWDEGPEVDGPYGPYLQSQRLEVYHGLAGRLVEQGNAYHCHCSREKLEQARRERPNAGGNLCDCRYLSPDDRAARRASSSEPGVIRFAMPTEGVTSVHDLVRGDVEWRDRPAIGYAQDYLLGPHRLAPAQHLGQGKVREGHCLPIEAPDGQDLEQVFRGTVGQPHGLHEPHRLPVEGERRSSAVVPELKKRAEPPGWSSVAIIP